MAEEEQRQAEWDEYWAELTDEEREREREMMAAYSEEKRQEREARGFDV
jgi:hypothetical protein